MMAPIMKITVKPSSEILRPNLSLIADANIAPKKQPAVRRETTFWEMWAFVLLAKPVVPVGRPKSFLKLARERTEDITPVSYPMISISMALERYRRYVLTKEQ